MDSGLPWVAKRPQGKRVKQKAESQNHGRILLDSEEKYPKITWLGGGLVCVSMFNMQLGCV